DALIHAIADRFPKAHGSRMSLLYQGRDALDTLRGQPLLYFGQEGASDASPPRVGMDREPVDIPPPAVERADDRSDDASVDFGKQYGRGTIGNSPPQIGARVRDAGRRFGRAPQLQNGFHILEPGVTD